MPVFVTCDLLTFATLWSSFRKAFIETNQGNVSTITGRKRTPAHRSASFMDERLNKLARRAEEEGGERGVSYPSSVSPTKGLLKAVTMTVSWATLKWDLTDGLRDVQFLKCT